MGARGYNTLARGCGGIIPPQGARGCNTLAGSRGRAPWVFPRFQRRVRPSPKERHRIQTRSVKLSVTGVSSPTRPMRNALGQKGTGLSFLQAQMFWREQKCSRPNISAPSPLSRSLHIPSVRPREEAVFRGYFAGHGGRPFQ